MPAPLRPLQNFWNLSVPTCNKFGREKYFYLGRDYAMGDAELNKKKFAALQGVARKILGDRFIS